jgi:cell division GTPase FtsZ
MPNGKNNSKRPEIVSQSSRCYDIAIPTLPLEDYEPDLMPQIGVEDTHSGSIKYAWIGSGQCGGRIVQTLRQFGYNKSVALNTTYHDLDLLEIPEEQKFLMDIGINGAGKDTTRGAQAVTEYRQEILHLCGQIFGEDTDHIMVAFGAGGGTGSGSAKGLIDLAKHYARHIGIKNPNKHVGAIMTLPTIGEAKSPLVAQNAHTIATELAAMAVAKKISPLIIVDNQKISSLYPDLTVKGFWPTINRTFSGLFDIFNKLSTLPSPYTAFDHADYNSIITSGGCCIMGLTRLDETYDKYNLSEAVRKNLHKTLLADGFDLAKSKMAGSVIVGGCSVMANKAGLKDNIDYAFDVLADIIGNATLHRGIYEDYKDSIRVYTIIGGLEPPLKRLEELINS